MSIRRRLDRLEAEVGGQRPFAHLPDAEILRLLALAVVEVPTPRLADARDGLYGPPRQGRFAALSDDDLLAELAAAQTEVARSRGPA